jgi:hypothetical protein
MQRLGAWALMVGSEVEGGRGDGSGSSSGGGFDEGAGVVGKGGPSPLAPWRYAMGCSEVPARRHARRLEREGWLARCAMVRGRGSLFLATRRGVLTTGLPLPAASPPGEPDMAPR